MKTRFNVWTKEPYGAWTKANAKLLGNGDAASMRDLLSSSGRELKVLVLPAGQKPPAES